MRFRASIRLHAFSIGRRRTAARAAVLAAALAAAPRPAPAQVSPNGPEFQVNTYTTNAQRLPSAAMDGLGNFVVAWQSYGSFGSDTSGDSIQAQRYRASGAPVGSQFQVNTFTTSSQRFPSMAANGDGNLVVAWQSYGSDGSDKSSFSIQAQRYAANGAPVGGQFQVNTYTTNHQRFPAVAVDGAGNFVVAWQSLGSGSTDQSSTSIQAQRYAANGAAVGGEFQVNVYTTGWQAVPSVAVDGAGNFVVAWQSYGSDGSDQSGDSIQAQRFAADGARLGDEFQVNTYTTSYQFSPSVSVDSAGNFVVAWGSYGSTGGDPLYSIQAQRYAPNGSTVGGEFQVNTYTTEYQASPSVAVDSAGGFVIAWMSFTGGYSLPHATRIQAQRFASNGTPVGGEIQVSTNTTNGDASPSVAVDGAGNFIVAWADGQYNGNYDIRAQRYDQLFRDGFEAGDSARWSATTP